MSKNTKKNDLNPKLISDTREKIRLEIFQEKSKNTVEKISENYKQPMKRKKISDISDL